MDLKELAKEAARTGLLAAVSAVVVFLGELENPGTVVTIVTVLLRAIDRGLHKGGLPVHGLVPF